MTFYEIYQTALASVAISSLVALALAVCFFGTSKVLLPIVRWIKSHKGDAAIVAPFVIFFAYYGSTKITATVTFPRTDPEVWYLMNNGSYVTNDWVHIGFNRNLLLPSTANFFVECLELSYTNQSDWADHSILAYSNRIGSVQSPFDLLWTAASNYNWIVYTDWTPPPTTHTNGVAYASWQRPINGSTNVVVTVKTGLYIGPLRVSPPPAMTNGVKTTTINLLSTIQEEINP